MHIVNFNFEAHFAVLQRWFYENHMVLNPRKAIIGWKETIGRSSRPKVFCQRPATSLKKRLWRRCFPVNFAEFLRTLFVTEHLRWLLLNWEPDKINLNGTEIKSSKNWKLLGVHIDKRLRFDVHIKSLCKTECSR